MGVGNEIINGVDRMNMPKKNKPKLIIHETDCHGCGAIYYKGICEGYSYDDGEWGDVRRTVEKLIDIGFINKEDVAIFEDDDIYKIVEKGLSIND